MKVYRIEDPVLHHGLWRDFDGSINPVFSKLTVGKCKDIPMDDSDFYRRGGKQWFSATDTPDKLKAWFDVLDVIEMEKLGYGVYEFEVTDIETVSPFEVVFTRDLIMEVRRIDPKEIWEDYMDYKALEIVRNYIAEHLDKSDPEVNFEVYIVWKAKALQNWKYLISSTLSDGMYYELTYNGDKQEWYLDAYKKFENRVVQA